MASLRNHFRRWSNTDWRFAHRGDLPSALEWILLAVVMLLMSSAGYAYDTIRLRAEAKASIETSKRVMGCLNGKNSLGEYTKTDGSRWVVMCDTSERRVASS